MDYRPIEEEDIRFAFAGYKAGALKDMAGPFVDTGLNAAEFKAVFEQTVVDRYQGGWTLFAMTPKGFIPVGMVFAFHSHFDPKLSPFMIVGDIVWFPWSSRRNRVEAAVNFVDRIRVTVPLVDYAHGDVNKRFWEMVARHGLVRRIGTTFNVVKGQPVAVFETRTD